LASELPGDLVRNEPTVTEVFAASSTGRASVGLPVAVALLAGMEAGVPIPIPMDLVLLFVGERAATGSFPLWTAIVAVEFAVATGTIELFLFVRGPGHGLVARFGSRFGVTQERIEQASALLERRGRAAVVAGRATPGFRTVTVVAAGALRLKPRVALSLLLLGSSLFVQAHLVLGFLVGEAARDLLERAAGWGLAAVALLAIAGIVVWISRRGRRIGARGWAEGSCPACVTASLLATKYREPAGGFGHAEHRR
jgi:membrane protein DedA with SNARE-associated domain